MNSIVSVIIPTYKRSLFLTDCIDTVLNQSYKDIEIIVVDDNGKGSTCQLKTEEALKSYIDNNLVKYIPHEYNRNGSAARNTGFNSSHGDYVLFLDDDDTLMPEMINTQLMKLKSLPEDYGAVYCNSIIRYRVRFFNFIRTVKTNSKKEGNLCRDYLLGKCRFNTSTILFRRSTIEFLEGFDETFKRHQDNELMVRFFSKYKIGCSFGALVKYDLTKDNTVRYDCRANYDNKIHFFNKRGELLKTMGIYDDIAHDFWLNASISAYLAGDKALYNKCKDLSINAKRDSVYDIVRLNVLKMLYLLKH